MKSYTLVYTVPVGYYGSCLVSHKIVKTKRENPDWEFLAQLGKLDACQIVLVFEGSHKCYTGPSPETEE
jgi:hypothetical protein